MFFNVFNVLELHISLFTKKELLTKIMYVISKMHHIWHARAYSYLQGFWLSQGVHDFIKHNFFFPEKSFCIFFYLFSPWGNPWIFWVPFSYLFSPWDNPCFFLFYLFAWRPRVTKKANKCLKMYLQNVVFFFVFLLFSWCEAKDKKK